MWRCRHTQIGAKVPVVLLGGGRALRLNRGFDEHRPLFRTAPNRRSSRPGKSLALARGHHAQPGPEHLLKVLLEEKDGLARALVQSAGGRPEQAATEVDAVLAKTPKVEGGSGQLYMKPETARVFVGAEEGAKKDGDAFVTTRAPF